MPRFVSGALGALLASSLLVAAEPATTPAVSAALAPLDSLYPELEKLYVDLHSHPELSLHEVRTSAEIASRLRTLGYDVTDHVGGYGVVAVLRNGPGPTVLLRADMDALPVEEKTGLPYASRVVVKNDAGVEVPVMHACGHDVHMASLVGAATLLSRAKANWRGSLVLVAQPAEELGGGASMMLKDGFLARFPKPDYAVAVHDSADLPAGVIGYTPGFALANVDSVDITVYGKGGHGSAPQATVDPIVIAARIVTALQTIVSRETSPLDPAVVTVGSVHGGTKHNVIPDEVKLQLTVRTYKPEVRKRILAAIERIARAEAEAGSAPRPPEVAVVESGDATYNDPALTERIAAALTKVYGPGRVEEIPPIMAAEDFGLFGRAAGAPSLMLSVGGVPRAKFDAARKAGTPLPPLHSPVWAPDPEPTIETGAGVLTVAALTLFGRP
jgi:amidohydrolase